MGYLMYFATIYGGGYGGLDANHTNAVIASISKDYGGGDNLPSATNQSVKAQVQAYMHAFPGPWSVNITMPPTDGPSGTYYTNKNYSGNVQILAANGAAVGGLALNVALGAGLTNFVWNNGTVTSPAGNLGFTFNMANPVPFSAQISIQGGAPAAVPTAYGAPAGSGYQSMLMAGAASPSSGLSGNASVFNAPANLTIQKSSTDPNYLGNSLAGGVFQIIDSNDTVVNQATTNAAGVAGPMQVPSVQTYTIHESVAPPGMTPAPDQSWTPGSGEVKTYNFTDPVTPVNLIITKVDSDTKQGLPGAQFTVAYDAANSGQYTTPITGPNSDGSFTTDANGHAIDPSGALTKLVPGNYLVTETVAPPGHVLPSPATQTVNIPPASTGSVTYSDITLPTVTTTPQADGTVGGTITDSATVAGASATASGTLTFAAYGPYDSQPAVTCGTGQGAPTDVPALAGSTPVFTSAPVTVTGSGTYPMSDTFTPTAPGLYQWVVSYSGDANNVPVVGQCADTTEQTIVVALATNAKPATGTQGQLSDSAVVSAPYLPTGGAQLTFVAYGPYTSATAGTCKTAEKVFTSAAVPVTANATAQTYAMTDSYSPTSDGVYEWIATLADSQDATLAAGNCQDANESSVVVGLTTNATATASTDTSSPLGNVIADNATIFGPVPTGSKVVFTAYGPYAPGTTGTCAAPDLVFTSAPQTLSGPGTVTSNQYTVTKAGTYQWTATLTDASGNLITADSCGATDEQSVVTTPAPVAPGPAPVGPGPVPVAPVPVTG
jgi:hypothetical protein